MKKRLLFVALISSAQLQTHPTCATQCADGYEVTTKQLELYELCEASPDADACRCILAQTFCNLDHKGLEPGTCPNNCNVAAERILGSKFSQTAEYLQEHLTEEDWHRVVAMLQEQGFYCGD